MSVHYEAVIKVRVADPQIKRASDISEGLGYACALLMDEYGWTAEAIEERLEQVVDEVHDEYEQRRIRGNHSASAGTA